MVNRYFLLVFALFPLHLSGQGVPLMTQYSSDEYNSHRQNWAVTQATDGKLYVGNSAGILIFDGSEWRLHRVGGDNVVRSLETASDGRVYYGGQNDFGYVSHDNLNRATAESIRNLHLPDSVEFGSVSSIAEYRDAIYFQSDSYIFKYAENRTSIIKAETVFTYLITIGGTLYAHQRNTGIKEVADTMLVSDALSEQFNASRVYGSISFDNEDFIFSRPDGITIQRDGTFYNPQVEWFQHLLDERLYRVAKIDESRFAVATLAGGIYIADRDMNLIDVIDETKGLPTNLVYNLYTDNEKNIWAALDNGISVIHYGQPVSTFGENENLYGAVTGLEKIGNHIYVGTTEGLFLMDTELQDGFHPVDGVSRVVDMKKTGSDLWVSDNYHLLRVHGDRSETLINQLYNLIIPHPNEDYVYLASGSELYRASLPHSRDIELILDAGLRIIDLVFHGDHYWILTATDVRKFDENGDQAGSYSLNRTRGTARLLQLVNGQIIAGTDWGKFVYDRENNFFIRQERKNGDPFGQVYLMRQCDETTAWLRADRKLLRGEKEDEEWSFVETPYQLIGADSNDMIYKILCDGEITWFGGANGLYHLTDKSWNVQTEFNTTMTRVFVNRDSLIHGGFGPPGGPIELTYDDNQLRFTFAASSYISPADTEFRVKLDGVDSHWSNWNDESFKDYTNIREGSYTLNVRSRNVYGVEGTEASFSFSILPPWYRTYWAYFLYILVFGAVLYGAHHIRVRQILKIQNIRNRIAEDLHDEVSATLSSISYFAKAVERQPKEKSGRFVSLISESADDAKDKITDIIWSINPKHDDWEGLMAKCRRFASDLMESKDIKHHIDIEDHISGKPKIEVRQHFWLIFKEILTNAVRHSDATQVNITIKKKAKNLVLIVQDNGRGFNKTIVEEGNGLDTVKKRAEMIGGSAELKSEEKFGTRWKITVDL